MVITIRFLSFNATNSTSGDISLTNVIGTLTVTGVTQTLAGNVTISNTGALTTTGAIGTHGGNVSLTTVSPDSSDRVLTIGSAGIATGVGSVNGGNITLTAANDTAGDQIALVVNGVLNTSTGTGGTFTLGGGVALNASPVFGHGNITLNGNGEDISLGTVNFGVSTVVSVTRDIIVTGALTTSAGSNLTLTADSGDSGTGGVEVEATGSINSAGTLTLNGSNFGTNPYGADTTSAIDIVSGSSGIQAVGAISLNGKTVNSNIDVYGPVTNTTAAPITVTPFGTGVINLSQNVTSAGGDISFAGPVTLSGNVTVDADAGTIGFTSVSGASNTLTLQDNTSGATGTATFTGNVTLLGLTTFAEPYAVVLDGSTNTFTNAVTFLNTAGVTLGNNPTSTFTFTGGLTSTASTTTTDAAISTTAHTMTLGAVTVAGNTTLATSGAALTIGNADSTNAGTNSLSLNSGAAALSFGVIGGTTHLNSFSATTSGANNITVANNITTSGSS